MKTVYDYSQLIHLWANGKAEDTYRSKSRNVSIGYGGTIRHWNTDIGQILSHKGKSAVVVDVARYSVTTSQIQSEINSAIHGEMFAVRLGKFSQRLQFTPQTLRDYYLAEYRDRIANGADRLAYRRAEKFVEAVRCLDNARRVCRFYGLAAAKLDKLRAGYAEELERFSAMLADRKSKLEGKRNARRAAEQERREREEQARISKAIAEAEGDLSGIKELDTHFGHGWNNELYLLESRPDLQEKVRAEIARRDALTVQDWLNGVPYAKRPAGETVLRVVGAEVETSKGASFPLADAERAFRFVIARREKGWHRNGEQFQIGDYQLDAVNEHGVVAGCHRLGWAEIERFAKAQGWA